MEIEEAMSIARSRGFRRQLRSDLDRENGEHNICEDENSSCQQRNLSAALHLRPQAEESENVAIVANMANAVG